MSGQNPTCESCGLKPGRNSPTSLKQVFIVPISNGGQDKIMRFRIIYAMDLKSLKRDHDNQEVQTGCTTKIEVSNPVHLSVAVSVHSLQCLWSYHWDQCTRSVTLPGGYRASRCLHHHRFTAHRHSSRIHCIIHYPSYKMS